VDTGTTKEERSPQKQPGEELWGWSGKVLARYHGIHHVMWLYTDPDRGEIPISFVFLLGQIIKVR
jgi:hypothetical protein